MASEKGYKIGRDESGMTARERDIVERMVQGQSQSAIGRELGISRQRVSEIIARMKKEQKIVAVWVPAHQGEKETASE